MYKALILAVAVIPIAAHSPGHAGTCELTQASYAHSYEHAQGMTNEHEHVVCSKNAEQPRLSIAVPKTPIAIRVTVEPEQGKQSRVIPRDEAGKTMGTDSAKGQLSSTAKASYPGHITVYFPFDSHVPNGTEKKKVIDAIGGFKGKDVTVKGYTSIEGDKTYNDALAKRRAASVADMLRQYDIAPHTVEGEGKCCYVSDHQERNRRAEIFVKEKGE